LELDKARIALEREQKALVFEQELHQRRLAHLDAEAVDRRHPNPQLPVSDDEGEISPVAKEVALSFPAVPQKEIAAIFEGKSDPANLYKLHRKVSLAMEDDEEISISGGKIHSKKRKGTAKDYPRPETWSSCFLQYVRILSCFDKYNSLTSTLIEFHARILELSHAYQWESALTLALTFHTERIVLGITDIKAWQMPFGLIDEHLRTAVKPNVTASAIPRSTASNAPTEFCHRWNNGDCNWSPCRRKHTCRLCGKGHKEIADHKDK
jgi:hypothetical protein